MDPILKYFENNWNTESIFYNPENQEIKLEQEKHIELIETLNSENIEYRTAQNKIIIEKENLNFSFFSDYYEFSTKVKSDDLEKNLFIPNFHSRKLKYEISSRSTFIDGVLDESNAIISNARDYFKLLEFLINQAKNQETTSFVDFHDEINNVFHIYSQSSEGSLKIEYPSSGIPKLELKSNFIYQLSKVSETIEVEGSRFLKFLRSALVKKVPRRKLNIDHIFYHLDEIHNEAVLNFGVFASEFSLDQLKSEYRIYKKQFFEDQNAILKTVSTSLLSLPISVVGSVFAIHKLKESEVGLCLIVGGIWLFSIYYSYLISVYYADLCTIKKNVLRDFKRIKENKFFDNHKGELKDFKRTKKFIKKRINHLTTGMWYFHLSVWASTITLSLFALHTVLTLRISGYVILFSLAYAIVITISHYYLFNKQSK